MANLATITTNILADSGIDDINVVVSTGSYANPAWITSLAWTKITGAPANIVTGTGSVGQVAFFNGTSSITGESNLFWDATNDRLGIGTAIPASKLQVDGTGYSLIAGSDAGNRRVYIGLDSTGEPSIQGALSNGTARQLIINPTGGNLLVGTTTDAGFKLDVNGTGRFVNNLYVNSSVYPTNYYTSLRSDGAANGILQLGNNGINYILAGNTATGGFLSIRVNVSSESISSGTEALRLNSNASAIFYSSVTATRYLVTPDSTNAVYNIVDATNTYAGLYIMQAGAGSSGFGGAFIAYGHSHATKAGWTTAGISSGSGGRFSVNTTGVGDGTDVFTVDTSGNGVFNGSVTANSTSTFSNASGISAIFSNGGAVNNFNSIQLRGGTAGTAVNWQISKDNSAANNFELAASTTAGGTTFSSPVFRIASNGNSNFSGSITSTSFIRSGGTSSQYLMADGSVSTLTNPVTGTGTTNFLPKFTGASTIGNSQIIDNGTEVGIGLTPSSGFKLDVGFTGTNRSVLRLSSNAANRLAAITFYGNNIESGTIGYEGGSEIVGGGVQGDLVIRNNLNKNIVLTGANVLVGTTTDSSFKLDVNGTGRFTSNLLAQKVQVGTAATINDATGVGNTLQFANYSAGVFVTGSADSYIYKTSSVFGGLSPQTLIFQTRSDVGGGGFAFVGGSTPSAVATISSTGAATFSSSGQFGGTLSSQVSNGGGDGGILFVKNTAGATLNSTAVLAFATDAGGTPTNNPRIQAILKNTSNGASDLEFFVHSGAGVINKAFTLFANSAATFSSSVQATIITATSYFSSDAYRDSRLQKLLGYEGGNQIRMGSGDPSDFLTFYAGASERMRIFSDGNVFIGSSVSNNGQRLRVNGNIEVTASNAFRASYDNSDSYHGALTWATLQLGNNGNNRIIGGRTAAGGFLQFYVNTTNDCTNYATVPNGTLALTLASTGAATFSSSVTATIGNFNEYVLIDNQSLNNPKYLQFDANISAGANTSLGDIRWYNKQWDNSIKAQIVALTDTDITNGRLSFRTGTSGVNAVERLRISSTGAATFTNTLDVGSTISTTGNFVATNSGIAEIRLRGGGYGTSYNTSLRSIVGAPGVLQMGNNGGNYILAGNTNVGGLLEFRVNCASESVTAGSLALRLNADTTATFASSVTSTRFQVTPSGSSAVYNFVDSNSSYTGSYNLQAGGGSSGFGGSLVMYGHSHASRAGFVSAGISTGSNGRFTVMNGGNGSGSDVFTVDVNGAGIFSSSVTATRATLNTPSDGLGIILNGRSSDNSTSIRFNSNAGAVNNFISSSPSNLTIASQGNTPISFVPNNAGVGTAALTIRGDGNVLIGTTTDNSNKLRVNGVGFFDQGIRTGNPFGSTTNNVLIGRFLTETASVNGSIRVQIGTRYYNIAAQDLGEVPS
jgi:hypothetical protein